MHWILVRICFKNCKKLSIVCILTIIAFVIYKLIITKIKRKRISIDIKLNKKSYGLQNGKTRRSKYLYNSKVLISTDDNGNAIKVVIENTENNSLFETMKDLMINLLMFFKLVGYSELLWILFANFRYVPPLRCAMVEHSWKTDGIHLFGYYSGLGWLM